MTHFNIKIKEMTIKQKFDRIDQSKLEPNQVNALKIVVDFTENFKTKDKEKIRVTNEKLDNIIGKLQEKNPNALKPIPSQRKTTNAKSSSTKTPKINVFSVAKQIKKAGESFEEAKSRASAQIKKEKEEANKTIKTEMQKLQEYIKAHKELMGISGTDLGRDATRVAKVGGRRISKNGNVYYENRENRKDRLAPNYPKNAPLLENGGVVRTFDDVLGETKIFKEEKVGKFTIGISSGFRDNRHVYIYEGGLGEYNGKSLPKNFRQSPQLSISEANDYYSHLKKKNEKMELGGTFAPNVSNGTQFMSGVYANGGDVQGKDTWQNIFEEFGFKKGRSKYGLDIYSKRGYSATVDNKQRNVELMFDNDVLYSGFSIQGLLDVLQSQFGKRNFANGGGVEDEYRGTIIDDSIEYIVKQLPYRYQIKDDSLGLSVLSTKEGLVSLKNLLHFKYGIDSSFDDSNEMGLKELNITSGQIVDKMANGGGVGNKKYEIKYNIGKSKYVVSYHDGVKKHKDGSDFYDIQIFKNKKDLENFTSKLSNEGYNKFANGGEFMTDPNFGNFQNQVYADGGDIDSKNITIAKRVKVKKWYLKTYPTDDLGAEIQENITFWSLWSMMSQGYDVYDILGVSDSLVRERVFEELSKILGIDYDIIYQKWLNSDNYAKGGIIVTKIKDIPNLKDKVDKGQVTYRGLGVGKLADDFYRLAGQRGTRIKVDGKEYFITDDDFRELNWDFQNNEWLNKIRFNAPARRYEDGGEFMTDPTFGNFQSGVYARGGYVSKGELVWRKLSDSDRHNFLYENFTPEITPRSQELLVRKDFNFLPKNVKIKMEAKYANVEDYAKGGELVDYSDNQLMVMNQNVQIEHHHEELEDVLKNKTEVPAWVVAKMATATQSISDVTHYLDGEKELLEEEEEELMGQDDDEEVIVNEIGIPMIKKTELTKKFTEDALGNLKGFLQGKDGIELEDDYTFEYKGKNYEIEPVINYNEKGISNAMFIVYNDKDEQVGEINYSNAGGKQNFTANSNLFNWNNTKFEDGGYFDGAIPKVSTYMSNYANGGEVAKAEIFGLKRNIMGTTDIEMKIAGMRKPQSFIVYPINKDDSADIITIQSQTRIGKIDLSTGRGLMSQSHANGAYYVHLQMDKKTPFTISESDLEKLKMQIFKTAGDNVGSRGIVTDNSGASKLFAKGGGFRERNGRKYDIGRNWTKDHNYINKSEKHEMNYNRKKSMAKGGLLTPKERYILEIKGLTGLRVTAIESYIEENELSNDDVLNIVIGLGRRQLKGSDVATAVVGKKGNSASKKLIAFAKGNEALKMADGGVVYADAMSKMNKDLENSSQVKRMADYYKKSIQQIVRALQSKIKVYKYKDGSVKLVTIDYTDPDSKIKVHISETYGKYELGGTVVTDLAGHTGAGSGGLDASMPLDGFSNTSYTGLVGETGAMSSGEMFARGGSIKGYVEITNPNTELFQKGYAIYGGDAWETFADVKKAFPDGLPKGAFVVKMQNGKVPYFTIAEKQNDKYNNGGSLPDGVQQSYVNYYLGSTGVLAGGGVIDISLNKKVYDLAKKKKFLMNDYLNDNFSVSEYNIILAQALVESLTDANFHSEAKEVVAKLEKQDWSDDLYNSKYYNADQEISEFGRDVARICDYDGDDIVNAYYNLAKTQGSSVGNLIDKLFLSKSGTFDEGGEVEEAIINKDGIKVKSVAQPKNKPTEAEWLAKYNESKEARTYKSGGNLSKYSQFIQDEFPASKKLANKFSKKYDLPFLVLVEKGNGNVIYVKEVHGFYAFPKSYIDAHDVLYVTPDAMAFGGFFGKKQDEAPKEKEKDFTGKEVITSDGVYVIVLTQYKDTALVKEIGNQFKDAYKIDLKKIQTPENMKMAQGGLTFDEKSSETAKRFDLYGYEKASNRVQDLDIIIKVNSYEEAEKIAKKYLSDYNLELVELYTKEGFVGSIRPNGKFIYSSRYKKEKFAQGGVTFDEKSSSIAKKFVGKAVEPKYQKEYGKVYSKEEANEVGDKIAGSMVAKEKMARGGDVLPPSKTYGENIYEAMNKFKISDSEARKKYGQYTINQWNDLLGKKMARGGITNRGGIMLLAKQIRKENESWKDALKRAGEQLRK